MHQRRGDALVVEVQVSQDAGDYRVVWSDFESPVSPAISFSLISSFDQIDKHFPVPG